MSLFPDHSRAIGELTVEWTHLEQMVFILFMKLTRLNLIRAEAIFYSVRSNPLRLQIVEALLAAQIKDEPTIKKFVDLRKRFNALANHRNEFAHFIVMGGTDDYSAIALADPKQTNQTPDKLMKVEDIRRIMSDVCQLSSDYFQAIHDLRV